MQKLTNTTPVLNPLFSFEDKESALGFNVPDVSMYGMLKISAESHPEADAIDYFGNKISYKSLLERIVTASYSYNKLGVKKGDIVTIIMPNTPEALVSIYALNRLGAVCNIVHPLSAKEEIKLYVNSVKSKVILAIDLCCGKISDIIDETEIEKVVVASAGNSMKLPLKLGYALTNKSKNCYSKKDVRFIKWSDFIKSGERINEYLPKAEENDEMAVLLHSGGTTGVPKEIMLSNRNFNSFGMQSVLTLRNVSVGDRILAILPIFHGFGLGVCVHVCFCFGACSVLIPKFKADEFSSILKKQKPTMIFGVPTLYEGLLKAEGLDNFDFSFLKYAISGGDSLPKPLEEKVNEFFKSHNADVKICEGYGMTEGLAAISLSVNENYKSGTIGKPLLGNEVCVVDPDTYEVLGPGEDGELCICGPTVMRGYRNNEEENATTLVKHNDGKVWLHTGDLCSIDEEGYISYKLRIKRLIISSGYNVYPSQIEKVVEEIPEVMKCTVVSMFHKYRKEVAKAYIILKNDYIPAEKEKVLNKIKEYCEKNLAHYSIPYKYEFLKEFPKTPYGKVDFRKLQRKANEEKEE